MMIVQYIHENHLLSSGRKPKTAPTTKPNKAPDQGFDVAPQVLPAH
jgi:hypothetical protein